MFLFIPGHKRQVTIIVAHGLQQLNLPLGPLAVRYILVGLIVIFIRGVVTQNITFFLARRQGVEL